MASGSILLRACQLPFVTALRWRVRNLPKDVHYGKFETPFMKVRKPGRSMWTDFILFAHRTTLTLAEVKIWFKEKELANMRLDQRYIPERHKILGPNLAAAHFIAARGGKVKFKGSDKWISQDELWNGALPSVYVPGFFVEEIDASGVQLCYEGFENLCNLLELKKLSLRNCEFVDDWCLNRSYLFETSLEYLDISGCHNVTERGICTLHCLKNLKTLVINDTPNIQNKELVCLLLQDIIPDCDIVGVDYKDATLLKRVEHVLN